MSGETEESISSWTVDSLHSHIISLLRAERDYVDSKGETILQRIADMDKAIILLSETINRTPTDLQRAVSDILRLMDERDHRVQDHFDAIRRLRESQTLLNQTALQAAFDASEKATAVSAASLDRTIEKNAELANQAVDALGARVTQVGEQVIATQRSIAEILASKVAVTEQKTDTRAGAGTVFAAIALSVGVLSFIMTIILTVTRL